MELPRGMKDFEESETANIEHIRYHFKQLSNLYGFLFMDPSPIELLSVLETKSGPAIRDEIYYFKDKGDREIGTISKNWGGLLKEMFTDADRFHVSFGNQTWQEKAVIFSAGISIDMDFFDDNQRNN